MLYQCLTRYKGSDSSEISLNKNDMVKILDKKDHGKYVLDTSIYTVHTVCVKTLIFM